MSFVCIHPWHTNRHAVIDTCAQIQSKSLIGRDIMAVAVYDNELEARCHDVYLPVVNTILTAFIERSRTVSGLFSVESCPLGLKKCNTQQELHSALNTTGSTYRN